ncbi:MAG TPA: mechanosensitive ion channel domain-containing protein [Hanamia sp.]|nr:mechanosensitive ion channel domain-containing protein [Hanamia sp.]
MKFLDQIFLDNSLRSYVITSIIILLMVILKRIISKYFTALVFKLGKTQWGGMTKQEFDNIIIVPLERILMVMVIILSLSRLNFPNQLEFSIDSVTSHNMADSIASAAIIICVVSLLIRFMDFLVLVIRHRQGNEKAASEYQVLFFFKDFIRVIIIIFGIVFILKYSLKLNIGNLLTGLSIVGAALALSARESLENLIASFIIFFDKPFKTGDSIRVNNVKGTVERIGLRSTRVRTPEKSLVTIPNKQMVDSILDNWSERDQVRNEIKTQLSSNTSSENLGKAIKKIEDILASKKERIISYNVYLQEITNDGALIMIIYFTKKELPLNDMNLLMQEINIDIRKMQEEHGIQAANTSKVTLVNPDNQ